MGGGGGGGWGECFFFHTSLCRAVSSGADVLCLCTDKKIEQQKYLTLLTALYVVYASSFKCMLHQKQKKL